LLGTVDNLRQKRYAEKVVEGLEGLVGVKNQLAVHPKGVEDDLRIVQELRLQFENVGLPVEGMGVQSLDRIVVLTGSVNTLHQKISAGMIVEEHPAVAALHNKLLVIP
ncbi:MAG: BON domain-containing protein, partial [Bacteroidota bacterium]